MKDSHRKGIDFGEWDKGFDLTGWIADYADLLDRNDSIIIFCSWNSLSDIIRRLNACDMAEKDLIVWHKSNPMPQQRQQKIRAGQRIRNLGDACEACTKHRPFLGGGAVLCALKPKRAVTSEANGELINMYQTVKPNAEELLEDFQNRDNEKFFYEIRAMDRREEFENADRTLKTVRLIYLQKACYNGLYRVNSRD